MGGCRSRLLLPRSLCRCKAGCKLLVVGTIQEIEEAARKLSPEELAAFRAWFTEFDAAEWDRRIARDIAEGRLDVLADEALTDLREGRCKDR
jgi:hypothetical protein